MISILRAALLALALPHRRLRRHHHRAPGAGRSRHRPQLPAARIDITGRLSVRYQQYGRDEALHGSFTGSSGPARRSRRCCRRWARPSRRSRHAGRRHADPGQPAAAAAADVDALAAEALGWPLPVAGLRDWLQGFVTDAAEATHRQAQAATPTLETATAGASATPAGRTTARRRGRIRNASISSATPSSAGDVAMRIVIDNWQTALNRWRLIRSLHDCPAPAKLNLFLHVTGRRADGYHLLQTVFQLLDYGDTAAFRPCAPTARSAAPRRCAGVPEDPTCACAPRACCRQRRPRGTRSRGADIALDKRLPMGGGLGGGSSDAATTLIALNHLWQTGLIRAELMALGLQLGADVPFFSVRRQCLCRRRGRAAAARWTTPARWFVGDRTGRRDPDRGNISRSRN